MATKACGHRSDSLAVHKANPVVSWFPPAVTHPNPDGARAPRPLVQEAIGWEFLSAQFNIVVNASEEHVGFVSA